MLVEATACQSWHFFETQCMYTISEDKYVLLIVVPTVYRLSIERSMPPGEAKNHLISVIAMI